MEKHSTEQIFVRTICAIVRNEARYTIEWIAYHRSIGIRQFVIYDNESSDETTDMLLRLEHMGWLIRIPWLTPDSGSPQLTAYSDFIRRSGTDYSFATFIDPDEFLALPDDYQQLDAYFDDRGLLHDSISAVAINQRVFGSSGRVSYDDGFVIERFNKAAKEDYRENQWFKSFFRPARIEAVPLPHAMRLKSGRYVTVLGEDLDITEVFAGQTNKISAGLRLNHYILKSLEEFRIKKARGGVSGATAAIRAARYDDDFFLGRDAMLNEQSWVFPTSVLENFMVEYQNIAAHVGV
jgi:hypothetical protein